MRRGHLLIATLLAVAVGAAHPASAAFDPSCCGCIPGSGATTSQAPTTQLALFCRLVQPAEFSDTKDACGNLDGSLICTPPMPGQSCADILLADEAIVCPAASPAPAASASGLAALALALVGLGVVAARRRAR